MNPIRRQTLPKRLGIAALLLGLAACAREGGPAPLEMGAGGDSGFGSGPSGGGYMAPRPLAMPASGPVTRQTAGGAVVVERGQTLYAVARQQNVPVRALIDANHLAPPYHINAGEKLIVPHIREHVVQPGETLYAVSRRYGVEATTLAQLNHLQSPYTLRLGTTLVLPTQVAEPSAATALAASAPPPVLQPLPPARVIGAQPPVSPPKDVKPPEAVAKAPESLAAPAIPPATVPPTPGTLTAPPNAAIATASPAKPVQAPAEPEEQPAGEAKPATPSVAVTVASIVANHRAPTAPLFYWPVRGRITSVFGPAAGGMHNDGVNISAPEGTTVSAAENGVVAYAGNELKGFGNLLLIKHSGGWMSAYAHSKVLLVKKGDHVRRGQPIAQVGATGGVTEPQLHFELRLGTKAIDPLDHLPTLSGGAG